MEQKTSRPDDENLRSEYSAICSNLNQLASFRFTLVGFYIAALGLITSGDPSREDYFLMLWISICFWILELRNRNLHDNMAERGRQIEREFWGYKGSKAYDPFISHWSRQKPLNDPGAGDPPDRGTVRFLLFRIKLPVSHTLGLDLMFLGVIVFSIVQMVS